MLTLIGYIAALIAILCLLLIDVAQRRVVTRQQQLLIDMAVEHRRKLAEQYEAGKKAGRAQTVQAAYLEGRSDAMREDRLARNGADKMRAIS
jgi:hypothetical protein